MEPKTAIERLIEAAQELGWNVAIPKSEPDDELIGLILGTNEYVSSVTDALERDGWTPPKPSKH